MPTSRGGIGLGAIAVLLVSLLCAIDCNPTLFVYDAMFHTTHNINASFANKRILLTGASSGTGASIASAVRSGPISSYDIGGKAARQVGGGGRSCPGKTTLVSLDIAGNETEAAMEKIINDVGGFDVLMLNAGKFLEIPTLEVDTEQSRQVLEVNLMANIRIATAVMKLDHWQSKEGGGHIVITSSLAGRLGVPVSAAYAAAKHALHGYFASLRAELAPANLRVDIVCPGPIDTEIFASSERPGDKKSIPMTIPASLMKTERASRLVISSVMGEPAFLFRETWIAKGLSLAVLYLGQYCPHVYSFVSVVLDPLIMSSYHEGEGFGGWGIFYKLLLQWRGA